MKIDLRPLNLGEVLDRTIQIFRSRFRMFIGIMAAGAGLFLLLQGLQLALTRSLGTGRHPHLDMLIVGGVLLICLVFVAIGAYIVVFAAMFRAVADLYTGAPTGVGLAYSRVWRRWFRYLRLYISLGVVGVAPFVVPMIALFVIAIAAAHIRAAAGTGGLVALFMLAALAMAAGLVLSVWLGLRYSLAGPASVFENAGVVQSFRRSAILSKGQRWRLVILLVLMTTIESVVAGLFMVPLFPLMMIYPNRMPIIVVIATLFISFFSRVVAEPILGIGLMVCYFDARIRREGFDVEWMLQNPAGIEANPEIIPPVSQPELTGLNPA